MHYLTIKNILTNLRYYIDVKHGTNLPSEEFWDGSYALVSHMWNDWLKHMGNGYLDTGLLIWPSQTSRHEYYISSYHSCDIHQKPFLNKDIWLNWKHRERESGYFSDLNLEPFGEYIPNNWEFFNLWKNFPNTSRGTRHINLSIYKYPILPIYYEYEILFNVNENKSLIKISLFDWIVTNFDNIWISDKHEDLKIQFWGLNKHFDLEYSDYFHKNKYWWTDLEKRNYIHHDFKVGQYFSCSVFWENPAVHYNYPFIPGFYFYWYERFGSVEFLWQAMHAQWHEMDAYLFYDSWLIPTIQDSYYFMNYSEGHCMTSTFQWIKTITHGPKFLWNDNVYMTKGINSYTINFLYAKDEDELRRIATNLSLQQSGI